MKPFRIGHVSNDLIDKTVPYSAAERQFLTTAEQEAFVNTCISIQNRATYLHFDRYIYMK